MQTDDEQDALVLQIIATAEVIGTVMSANAAAMIAEDLEIYPFIDCCAALKKCRAEVRGKLVQADVVNRIHADDGRLGRDEAWAIALQSADEKDTVVWTEEISAAYDAAKPVLMAKDKVGARMAFMSAYDRLLVAARASGEPAKWLISQGWDPDLRDRALETAVRLHRLPLEHAKAFGYLSAPMTADGKAIAGLLTGPSRRMLALSADEKTRAALMSEGDGASEASPEIKERLHVLRQQLVTKNAEKEQRRVQLVDAQRRDLEQRKQKVADQVAEMLAGEKQ